MATSNITFEEVDRVMRAANLAAHTTSIPSGAAAIPNLCGIYGTVRPFLLLVVSFPFIPATWIAAIKAFMAVLDQICKSGNPTP